MSRARWLFLAALVVGVAAFFAFGGQEALSPDGLRAHRATLDAWQRDHPVALASGYFAVYLAVAALSLPDAVVLTLLGGALFGFTEALLLVSFASSIGATLGFVLARAVARDWVQQRFGNRLAVVNEGVERDGAFYLFALRLVPIVPFWLVNIAMAMTPMRVWPFYWVSQLAMLPGTAIFVYAGAQLGRFEVSSGLVAALALLGLFPLLARRTLSVLKARRVYRRWAGLRPARFDYNLVVIGAGSAGLVSAFIAASTRARVAVVEQHRMGGDCLNTGCVPSKALIRSAKLLSQIARATEFGLTGAAAQVDFAAVMERIGRVIRTIEPHDSVERYNGLGAEVVLGKARITSPWTVDVETAAGPRRLTTRSIVIAAGAHPVVPAIPGLDDVGPVTSDTVWNLRERPGRLVILGGGPIGCELAQAFARLGSQVTIVEVGARLMAREDPDVSAHIEQLFAREGVRVLTEHTAVRCQRVAVGSADPVGRKVLIAHRAGQDVEVPFDQILVAVGRVANTTGYGLEELGIGTTAARTIETDDYLQTLYPNIYACGDVAGPYQFTHTAAHQAWYASVNALFGTFRRFKADYRVIPWVTFTDPEVARVGLNEQDARQKGISHAVSIYHLGELDRAIADEAAHGFVKVLTPPGGDAILGVTIVGEHAGELIAEYVLAMKQRIGLRTILGTIHAYPTMAEANKYAAGAWRRAQVTGGQTTFLAAFQAWRRGASGLMSVVRAVWPLVLDRRRPAPAPESEAR